MVISFNKNFKLVKKEWIREREKWENKWKKIIGEIVWIHLKIENSMLSMIISLQNVGLGSKERKEVEELNFLMAAKTCFIMGYIDYELYEEVKGFNAKRNYIVHKIFKKPKEAENLLMEKLLRNGERINRKVLDAHFSVEENKAKKMLGGRSEAGFPILYGNAKQKLKQLEGYGVELIEETKEKLKKEIKENENDLL